MTEPTPPAETLLVTFPEGIPGMPTLRSFGLVFPSAERPLGCLQCMTADVGFILIEPLRLVPTYAFDLSDEDEALLQVAQPDDVAVFAIVAMAERAEDITANLAGPIVINLRKGLGKQMVLNNPNYSLRHPVLQAMAVS